MTAIENIIREIESEVRQHGNTKARIGAVLRLLKNKIVDLFSSVGGKLDKGGYTGTALDLNSAILQRVVKESGKGLSTNDFTQQYKQLLDELKDYDIDLDEHTTELMLKKGEVVVKRIGLAFLNDEGTKLFYNEQKKQLELKNDEGRVLSEIPISHLVANMPTGIVVQNGKIRLMAGSKVIEENVISYNNLADKPELNFLPTSGGTVNGNVNLNGELLFNDKAKVVVRPDGKSIAFGNKEFTDLIVGEFKGIQIWGHDNNKIVLAGGGVKDISDFDYLPVKTLSTGNIYSYLHSGKFFAGETTNVQGMPDSDWMHVFGARHTNPNNNFAYYFAIPFNNKGYNNFYFTNRADGEEKPFVKFIGFQDVNNKLYKEHSNEHGYAWHFPSGAGFRVFTGEIGSGQLKLEVTENEVYSPKRIETDGGFHFRNRSNDDVLMNNGKSILIDEFFVNRNTDFNININSINTFKKLPNGAHKVEVAGQGGCLAVFRTNSSANSIQLLAPTYENHRLQYNWSIDDDRYGSTFRELAYYEDIYKSVEINENTQINQNLFGRTLNVTKQVTLDFTQYPSHINMSIRKCFSGFQIDFNFTGKTVIYTADNTFNGGDGSTAIISSGQGNKIYVDIRNV